MNQLSFEKRCRIIRLLVEGNSLRSITRIVDVSINTVTKLLIDAGKACMRFHNETVKDLSVKRMQVDEIWSFVYKKEASVKVKRWGDGIGDVWTWVAIDADTRLVISWSVGERDFKYAHEFMKDIKSRLNCSEKLQISSDGFLSYWDAIRSVFGGKLADYGVVEKYYGKKNPKVADGSFDAKGRFVKVEKRVRIGEPDMKHISTSYMERQNLTIRMCNRRFNRKTNAFSKKIENHIYALSLHFVYYNFVRIHKTLRVPPAMEAGLIKRLMSIEDIVRMINTHPKESQSF
jgi:IS1 family transposase